MANKYPDWGTQSPALIEQIALTRRIQEGRTAFGFPATMPESAVLDAMVAELIGIGGGATSPPGNGRTNPTATDYLAKNVRYNPRDFQPNPAVDIGNGLADCTASIAAAEAAAAPLGAGLQYTAGTYRIDGSRTFATRQTVPAGAVFRPSAGTVLTFAKGVDAGPYQIFDLSLGGTVSFQGANGVAECNAVWFGAKGDGTTDDGPAIGAAHTAAGPAGLEFLPGVYRMNSSVTLSRYCTFHVGAQIKPGPGVTVAFTGAFDAPPEQMFDFTAGGKVSFIGNTRITAFNPRWWGVLGDDNADDAARLGPMVDMLPEFSTVLFPQGMVMRLYETWTIASRRGIRFVAATRPQPDGVQASCKFRWFGSAGGTMIFLRSCDHVALEGFYFEVDAGPNSALVAVDMDKTGEISPVTGSAATGTECFVSYCVFNCANKGYNANWVACRIAETVAQNQEYHHFLFNKVFGSPGILMLLVSASAGNATITNTGGNTLNAGMQGRRVRIEGAGPAGAVLDTTFIWTGSSATFNVATPPSTSVSAGTRAFVGDGAGVGVKVGSSPNAKKIQIEHNSFQTLGYGVWVVNGSVMGVGNSYTGNAIDRKIDNSTEPCVFDYENSEQSLQALVTTTNQPVALRGCRHGNQQQFMGGGYIVVDAGTCGVNIEYNTFDASTPAGCYIYDLSRATANLRFVARANRYHAPMSWTNLGYDNATALGNNATIVSEDEFGIDTGAPSTSARQNDSTIFTQVVDGGDTTALQGIAQHKSGGGTKIGVRGVANPIVGVAAGGKMIGVQGETGTSGGNPGAADHYAVRAVMPNWTGFGATVPSATGYTIVPTSASIGNIVVAYGYRCPPLLVGVVNEAWGFYQEGASDKNFFAGPTTISLAKTRVRSSLGTPVAAGWTDTFDASAIMVRRVVANNAAITVANPTNAPTDGDALTLDIKNNTGGAVAITLGPVFAGTFPGPGAGKRRTQKFIYDGAVSLYVPDGAQSPDF